MLRVAFFTRQSHSIVASQRRLNSSHHLEQDKRIRSFLKDYTIGTVHGLPQMPDRCGWITIF
jgi:hypothetical protein